MLPQDIERIFVINLPHRTDRLNSITKELERMGLLDRMEVVEGVALKAHGTGTAGVALAHMRCVQLAKERGYKYAMILEDDAKCLVSAEEFEKELTRFLECSEGDEWYCLWFGSFYTTYGCRPQTNYCIPIKFNQDTATLVHARGYDVYIRYLQYCADSYVSTGLGRYNMDSLLNSLNKEDSIEQSFVPLKEGVRVLNNKLCGQADDVSDRTLRVMAGGHGISL